MIDSCRKKDAYSSREPNKKELKKRNKKGTYMLAMQIKEDFENPKQNQEIDQSRYIVPQYYRSNGKNIYNLLLDDKQESNLTSADYNVAFVICKNINGHYHNQRKKGIPDQKAQRFARIKVSTLTEHAGKLRQGKSSPYSERTVYRSLEKLKKLGYITREQDKKDKRFGNYYVQKNPFFILATSSNNTSTMTASNEDFIQPSLFSEKELNDCRTRPTVTSNSYSSSKDCSVLEALYLNTTTCEKKKNFVVVNKTQKFPKKTPPNKKPYSPPQKKIPKRVPPKKRKTVQISSKILKKAHRLNVDRPIIELWTTKGLKPEQIEKGLDSILWKKSTNQNISILNMNAYAGNMFATLKQGLWDFSGYDKVLQVELFKKQEKQKEMKARKKENKEKTQMDQLELKAIEQYNKLGITEQKELEELAFWGLECLVKGGWEFHNEDTKLAKRLRLKRKRELFEKNRIETVVRYLSELERIKNSKEVREIKNQAKELKALYEQEQGDFILTLLCTPDEVIQSKTKTEPRTEPSVANNDLFDQAKKTI